MMNVYLKQNLAILLLAFAVSASASAGDRVLFDFTHKFDLAGIATNDGKVSAGESGGKSALRVVTGHHQPWPGIRLSAPGGHWDLASYARVSVKVRDTGRNPVTVYCRVDNPGADGARHCVTGLVRLRPGDGGTVDVPLKRASDDTLGGKLFGMRGYPVAPGGPKTVDPTNITQLLIFVSKPTSDHEFEISDIVAAGRYVRPTAWVTDATPFFPFIDTFGQYDHQDWPGKTHSLADLAAAREREAAELAARPGPKDWDKYGGWLGGPQLKATGFFRTEKVGGKWWLVDPDGHLFFSNGIDCVGTAQFTPVEERASWFRNFPGKRPEFAKFFSHGHSSKGHYAGRMVRCFSFTETNLRRKYGPEWQSVYRGVVQKRLRSWGINTIGNWSDEAVRLMDRTPYTDAIGSGRSKRIEGSGGYWGRFPDVFDPGFAEGLRRSMESKKGRSAGDPWCIGYFSDNEMSWGNAVSLAVAALRSPPDQPVKKVFVADLKAKYGAIARLNRVWGTDYASWETLQQSRKAPDPKAARADLTAFYTKIAEQYFRTVRDIIKAIAPHQLYLGCRFASRNPRAEAAAAKYCDVVSYNLYRRNVRDFHSDGGADVPLLIGEFHFGALDRGLFHTGLVPVSGQSARGRAYKEYVLSALQQPQMVGCHWFQYQDEPVTGRVLDGENYQIGFVDVADTPYPATIDAGREVGRHLYEWRNSPGHF